VQSSVFRKHFFIKLFIGNYFLTLICIQKSVTVRLINQIILLRFARPIIWHCSDRSKARRASVLIKNTIDPDKIVDG
jgi:hypothetical protein